MVDFSAETAMRQGGHAAEYQSNRAKEEFENIFGEGSAEKNIQAFCVYASGFMQAATLDAGFSYLNVHLLSTIERLVEEVDDLGDAIEGQDSYLDEANGISVALKENVAEIASALKSVAIALSKKD